MHNLTTQERKTLLADINHGLLTGGMTLGQAARRIRTELYQMSQTQYAAFIAYLQRPFEISKRVTPTPNCRY
jgi:hypothetical protein